MDWLTSVPMAHRGLHDFESGVVENSASAYQAAIDAGYGIECDVQVSSDGEAMVFHDRTLNRMTEETGPLAALSASELGKIKLKCKGETIQTLPDLLDQVGGKVPLLVEIKSNQVEPGPLEARVAALLKDYQGPVAMMCFNPKSVAWFREQAPSIVRGQLSTAFYRSPHNKRPAHQNFAARHLLVNLHSRPHFVGYDIKYLPSIGPRLARLFGTPLLTWTVKTRHHVNVAKRCADNIIFEGFKPSLNWPQDDHGDDQR